MASGFSPIKDTAILKSNQLSTESILVLNHENQILKSRIQKEESEKQFFISENEQLILDQQEMKKNYKQLQKDFDHLNRLYQKLNQDYQSLCINPPTDSNQNQIPSHNEKIEMNKLKSTISDLKLELKSLETTISEKQTQIDLQSQQLSQFKAQLKVTESLNKELKFEISVCQQEKEELLKNFETEYQERIKEFEKQLDRVQNENQQFQYLLETKTLDGSFIPLSHELAYNGSNEKIENETLKKLEEENRALLLYIQRILGKIMESGSDMLLSLDTTQQK